MIRHIKPNPEQLLEIAGKKASRATECIEERDRAIISAWQGGCSFRDIAEATGIGHMTVQRIVHRSPDETPRMNNVDTWSRYESRFSARPETFRAYVDVWRRVPRTQQSFRGWAAFTQAASAEPKQSTEKVREAEACMRLGGYELGALTQRGARRWIKA